MLISLFFVNYRVTQIRYFLQNYFLINSTVFDSLLRKRSRYTSSIIGNNNNDASKRTSYNF